jgi:predicted permease
MDLLRAIWQDFRYGARQLRLNPAFAAVAVLSLALGIGANTAIFELVNAVRLRSLPVEAPEQLVTIDFARGSHRQGNFSTRSANFTSAMWRQILAQQQALSGVMAWSAQRFNLARGGEVRWAEGLYVSANYLRVLGVQPVLGRTFTDDEDRSGCGAPPAVISYGFWQQEFAGASDVLGRSVMLDGRTFPVVGVTPPGFFGVEVGHRYDVAIPLCADALMSSDGKGRAASTRSFWLSAMGRLKPGWTAERAAAQWRALSPAFMQATLPESYRPDVARDYLNNKLHVEEAANGVSGLRTQYSQPLWLLLATTGLVLLIACANLANLLLARASVREREIAVRQAIGASRARLIGQLMAESLLLAIAGTLLGAASAQLLSRGLIAFLSGPNSGMFLGLQPDARVLAFTAAIAVTTCLLFGLVPAMRATRIAPASAMRAGGRGLTTGRERFSLRRALVVAQVALSLVLLVGALLFIGSLRKLLAVDPGFQVRGLVVAELNFQRAHYPKERNGEIHRELAERLRSLPGVISASEAEIVPLGGSSWNEICWAEGGDGKHQIAWFNSISGKYFRTTGTPFVAGRDFDDRDTPSSPKVAIVNEAFVKKVFGNGNPVGRTFLVQGDAGQPDDRYQVVGLVRNSKYGDVREDFKPLAYTPASQLKDIFADATFMLRTSAPFAVISRDVKQAAAQVSPVISIEFTVLTKQIDDTLLRDRLMATLAGAFGVLAGVLATIGLYGVIAYMVARRRNEIGIRVALGADRAGVIGLVLREAALLLGLGLLIGGGLALWAGRAAASLLFGLKPNDAATLAGAMALLAAVALAASYGPARRAAKMEPMQALREE